MNTPAPGLCLTNVSQTLGSHVVFSELTLTLDSCRWHCFLGRSGVGKTTLLRLIAGLDDPQQGCIGDEQGRSLRRQVSYMSQDDGLLPWLSVVDNVQLGPRLRHKSTPATHARAMDLLSQVNLSAWAEASIEKLSGGMRQRVALARTLLEDRPVVLMDEPFSRLDAITRDELQILSSELLQGRTIALVTHDPYEALRLGHCIYVLQRTSNSEENPGGYTAIIKLDSPLRSQGSKLISFADIGTVDESAVAGQLSTVHNANSAMRNLWSLLKSSHHGC